jgi:hypothetical protein
MEPLASNHFVSIAEKLDGLFSAPHENKDQKEAILAELASTLQDLDRTFLSVNREGNALQVQRAAIIGRICRFVKDSLLHGQWTDWAEKNFQEDIRTLQKYMAIARSPLAQQYGHLGTEKAYQVTRIEHLVSDQAGIAEVFSDCGLESDLERCSSKAFEKAVIQILNKETLEEMGISLPSEALRKLTENFSLIEKNNNVLSILAEAKSEEANLERVVENMVASGGGKKALKKEGRNMQGEEDVNRSVESLIRALQAQMDSPARSINEDKLRFLAQLIQEYLQKKGEGK